MSRLPVKRVVWAVDITAPAAKPQRAVVKALAALGAGKGLVVEPVHVVTPRDSARPSAELEGALRRWVSEVRLRGLGKPSLVRRPGLYLRSDVDALVRHARKRKAGLIALTTHARRGIARLWMGSFAETLLLHSPLPLFLVSPAAKVPSRFRTILCPTDLGRASRKVFDRVVPLAAALDAELVLFHWLQPYWESASPSLVPPSANPAIVDKVRGKLRRELGRWAERGRKAGARVTIRLGERGLGAAEAILAEAKRLDAVLLTAAAESGPLKTVLVGSVTRKLVREASCPVWVIRA